MMTTATLTLTLFLTFLTLGFHHVRSNTLTPESLPSSPPEQPHRTAFHFQPPQNWMNGNLFFLLFTFFFFTFSTPTFL
ncbi:putative glycosidase [Helianthus annuus]|nr:putative glycosidase [Helianthus annuus]KAJ0824769.1 putative glycosidase [Helianthus annuus]